MGKFALNDRSTKTSNINGKKTNLFSLNGVDMSVSDIAKVLGVTTSTIYNRLHKGYAINGQFRRGRVAKPHAVDGRLLTAKDISKAFGRSTSFVYGIFKKCSRCHIGVTSGLFVK